MGWCHPSRMNVRAAAAGGAPNVLGVYRRSVLTIVLGAIVLLSIPVPRFRCRKRGPRKPSSATFSVLPAQVLPRRRCSLSLFLQVLRWRRKSSREALEELFVRGIFVEGRELRRVSVLANQICDRLRSFPVEGYDLGESAGHKRIERLLRVMAERRADGERDPPAGLVLAWQKQYGQLLARVSTS